MSQTDQVKRSEVLPKNAHPVDEIDLDPDEPPHVKTTRRWLRVISILASSVELRRTFSSLHRWKPHEAFSIVDVWTTSENMVEDPTRARELINETRRCNSVTSHFKEALNNPTIMAHLDH